MLSLTNFYLVAHVENMKSMSIIHKELKIYEDINIDIISYTMVFSCKYCNFVMSAAAFFKIRSKQHRYVDLMDYTILK